MLYIGVMTGTSCDGVDVVLVDFTAGINTVASNFIPYSEELKSKLSALINNEPLGFSFISELDAQLGHYFAEAVLSLMADQAIQATAIKAIGLHGQTVYHQTMEKQTNNTHQIGSAAIVAARTGITTIANFRQLDVALGGQGAPLAPALHEEIFASAGNHVVVLNLGGIANITSITDTRTLGFDTGPANCLMDEWIQQHRGVHYDNNGAWAAGGQVISELLSELLSEPYFTQQPPKSTGRELFNSLWLAQRADIKHYAPVDIQRTLLQLSVESITLGMKQLSKPINRVIVCGGGVHNELLMTEISQATQIDCQSSSDYGVNPDYLEAVLMAWLAKQRTEQKKLDLKLITGAKEPMFYGVEFVVS